ncbi:Ger(x)C family spore germination protein [Paenibacillus sp. sptzw28]|uniref:Ger(x)C family spore germination protein n=1 Tax=Paenibacillus sp. sptzw28 TaxID=715179 RepID=UPI001C6EE088|nr:Ger(x)C family spore germination protein [Paenibacillus sp. sptzw28]QYR20748.1 Ger(x)C family spore germination protein [Paenibacillus sp. sptzw28]
MLNRLIPAFLVLGLSAALTSGCWDRKEILDVAIVMITAVDEGSKPGTYRAHAHMVDPKRLVSAGSPAQGGAAQPIVHVPTEGRNINEARSKAELSLPRDIMSSHRRVFLMGESLARKGVAEVLDQISRNPQNRLNAIIAIAENSTAEKMIDLKFTMETFGAEVLRELTIRKARIPTSIKDFYIASTTPGQQPVAVSFVEQKGKISISGIAIFKDYKLVGFLKGLEAGALNGLLGGSPRSNVMLRVPGSKGDISIQVSDLKARGKVDFRNGKPVFTFRFKVAGKVLDNGTNIDLSNPQNVEKVNKVFSDKMERACNSMFARLQHEYKADSAGLGAMIYRKDSGYWERIEKRWPSMYVKQKVICQVETTITNVGSIGAPLYIPEKEVKK